MNQTRPSLLKRLLDENKEWRESLLAEDDTAFSKFADGQQPEFFWLGCSDSRVPSNLLAGLGRGDAFVHRNIANQVKLSDTSVQAAIAFAVDTLGARQLVVCGHYGCGGIQLASGHDAYEVDHKLREWVAPITSLSQQHSGELDALAGEAKLRRLCEINVQKQVNNVALHPSVRDCWARGESLAVHGLIYDLADGTLYDLHISRTA
ncbi:MAG: carbonic anhydrase [Pseudomonadales bacterium]